MIENIGPRISAVICTYRRPDTLPGAIRSLQKQTLPATAYEVIVVDNNSNDATAEIVQSYQRKAGFDLHYVLETRQGLSHARNAGIRKARAEIVAFLDDDAVAAPDWLGSLLDVYRRVPDAWAVGGKVSPIWDGARPKWLRETMLRSLSLVDWGDEERPLKWPERVIGTNFSFRKQVFSEIGLFLVDLGRRGDLLLGNEDTEIQERIHELHKVVVYTPRAVVRHHVPVDRMTKQYFYGRAYGTGRSEAILAARTSDRVQLLRQTLQISRSVLASCARPWRMIGEESRFGQLQFLARRCGFLYQTMGLLFQANTHREAS
ncbi:MAG TPA: glycosyltransferase [Candidatus Eisenbacteria bacterium]|nr:glycosyltransferase [Candidatus Eisenbacteria bacterium]